MEQLTALFFATISTVTIRPGKFSDFIFSLQYVRSSQRRFMTRSFGSVIS
jgi:hypothetical protein